MPSAKLAGNRSAYLTLARNKNFAKPGIDMSFTELSV
jgi:hypothetical protein